MKKMIIAEWAQDTRGISWSSSFAEFAGGPDGETLDIRTYTDPIYLFYLCLHRGRGSILFHQHCLLRVANKSSMYNLNYDSLGEMLMLLWSLWRLFGATSTIQIIWYVFGTNWSWGFCFEMSSNFLKQTSPKTAYC